MKFSIPSVNEITAKVIQAVKRFPFALLAALIATFSALGLIEVEFNDNENYYWLSELGIVSTLGISLFLAIQTLSESLNWELLKNATAKFIGFLFLTGYYFIPGLMEAEGAYEVFYRFFLFVLISHLFVAFAPFIQNKNVNQFWGYNKTLFLNILTSALYSAVLFVGLSIALLSIDNLLGFEIKGERYLQLWVFLVGIFNTFFFLTRVPKVGEFESTVTEYPKALKVFVQYVLIPIVTIYILILYSYLAKIIFQWELPNGWVANLVLSFSIAGIFSLLLLHPIKNEAKNNWILFYSKLYYIGLVPLVVLLFVSIGTRISEYGVTINRFYVATLAVWLAGIVLYFIFSKSKNIKIIPVSLAVIALGITFGPLSAFSVSERSQLERMKQVLNSNNMIDESGKIVVKKGVVDFKDRAEISSIARYMIDNHEFNSLEILFNEETKAKFSSMENKGSGYRSEAEKMVWLMGLEYVESWENEETGLLNQNRYYELTAEPKTGVKISDYTHSFNGLTFYSGTPQVNIVTDNRVIKLVPDFEKHKFVLKIEGEKKPIEFSLIEVLESIQQNYPASSLSSIRIPVEEMTINAENESLSAMMVLQFMKGSFGNNTGLNSVRFSLYVKFKK